MIKKIKIIDNTKFYLRDTTVGKIYDVTFHEQGTEDTTGCTCLYDTLCLIDDAGDNAALWVGDDLYEVVEED